MPMELDAKLFNDFFQRSLASHKVRLPHAQIDEIHFGQLARAKWSTFSNAQKEIYRIEMARAVKNESSESTPLKKTKGSAMKKDPNAPKRARSAYIVFSTAIGKIVRQENPDMSQPDVMREVSKRWNLETDKSKYEKEAAADKERYNEEMGSYSPPPAQQGDAGTKKPKAKKDPNAPKKPRSAYILFSMDEGKKIRESNPSMSSPEVMKLVGQRWSELDPKEKQRFEEKSAADKERYNDEAEAYQGGEMED